MHEMILVSLIINAFAFVHGVLMDALYELGINEIRCAQCVISYLPKS